MPLLRSAFGSVLHPLLPIWPPLSGSPERQVVLFPRRQLPWWHTPEGVACPHTHTLARTHTITSHVTNLFPVCVLLPDGRCRARKCAVSSGHIASLQAGRCLAREISHVKTDTPGYESVVTGFLQLYSNFKKCFVRFIYLCFLEMRHETKTCFLKVICRSRTDLNFS